MFSLRERENVICYCEILWLGSGRCFQISDQRTYSKVVKGTSDFKTTCFHRFDAGKLHNNVRKLTFLGSPSSAESSDYRSMKIKLRLS